MKNLEKIQNLFEEILDIEPEEIQPEKYVIRELEAESIDLLEIAINLNRIFETQVMEDLIFLKNIRAVISKAKEDNKNVHAEIKKIYSFLPDERITEILGDLNNGPVLKVKDLLYYLREK